MTVNRKKFPEKKLGRPPKRSDEELHVLGQEMIELIKKNKEWLFLQEYATHMYMPFSELMEMGDREAFSGYYEVAKQILGARICKGAGKEGLHPAIASRFLACYHNDVKHHDLKIKGIATDYATNRILDTLAKSLDASKNSLIKE